MTAIEVTWKVKPQSGITFIELYELGCKTKKEWLALDRKEQEKRINAALEQTDGGMLRALVTEW